MFDFPYDFWDSPCRMPQAIERINKIEDFDGEATVIPSRGASSKGVTGGGGLTCVADTGDSQLIVDANMTRGTDAAERQGGSSGDSNDLSHVTQPNVSPENCLTNTAITTIELNQPPRELYESKLMSPGLDQVWRRQVVKLEARLKGSKFESHRWRVRTWDKDGVAQGRIDCLECDGGVHGSNKGVMDKISVTNSFSNFRTQHLLTSKHFSNWHRKRNLAMSADNQALVGIPGMDDRVEVELGVSIVEKVNAEQLSSTPPFLVTGDLMRDPCYSEYYKVKCVFCGDHMSLVPSKGSLEQNLRDHVQSVQHQESLERPKVKKPKVERLKLKRPKPEKPKLEKNKVKRSKIKREGEPLTNGLLEGPSVSDKRDLPRTTIHGHDLICAVDSRDTPYRSSDSMLPPDFAMGLSQLCWGSWREFANVGGDTTVRDLVDDQVAERGWWAEPYVSAAVFNVSSGVVETIHGLFRHKDCVRISRLGGGFEDLTCEKCYSIKPQNDFRFKLLNEDERNPSEGVHN